MSGCEDILDCRRCSRVSFLIYHSLNTFLLTYRTPSFLSVIPDGAYGTIPLGRTDAQSGLGTGFTWRPPVRAGANLIIVGSDSRGTGAGGFLNNIVSPGNPSRDGACPAVAATTSRRITSSLSKSTTCVRFFFFCFFVFFFRSFFLRS